MEDLEKQGEEAEDKQSEEEKDKQSEEAKDKQSEEAKDKQSDEAEDKQSDEAEDKQSDGAEEKQSNEAKEYRMLGEDKDEDEDEDEDEEFLRPEEIEEMEEDIFDMEHHMSESSMYSSTEQQQPSLDRLFFPPSYKENSSNEQMLLKMAENFSRQYSHLYPDREPLFMNPVNECGVEKFVSTTLRPTLLPYTELYAWDECANFVAEYLSVQLLQPAFSPPKRLYSSATILKLQMGNSFDFSVLLCSLLLGAGYDAYCVSGYATKEMCQLDESTEDCPLVKKPEETSEESEKKIVKKYTVKPVKDLRSKFELAQEAKKEAKIQEALDKANEEQQKKNDEIEIPKRDRLYGLRVHCWVLVLAGKREVPETFFIDPFTGYSYNTGHDNFLGVESLWNHENYWVNMQDCRNGTQDMTFDLGDPVTWEFLLLSPAKPLLAVPEGEEEDEVAVDEPDETEEEEKHFFSMPPSWTELITVSPKEFETRSPGGKKVIQYKKAWLEKWAPYFMVDGLVARLTVYDDVECTHVVEVREWYKNRFDKLEMKEHSRKKGLTTAYFAPERSDCLRVHIYKNMIPETERTMMFYTEARVDGLKKRSEKPLEMTELFEGRSDFLHYRHTVFNKRPKRVAIAGEVSEAHPRPIKQITERFRRNREKSTNEDVTERIFLIHQDRFQLTFHRDDDRITASKWEFLKPPHLGEKEGHVVLMPETSIYYQVEPIEKWNKQLYVYEMLTFLLAAEKDSKEKVRQSEAEVLAILSRRADEVIDNHLTVSIYDTERNEKSKRQREAIAAAEEEERARKAALEMDYLAPFLAKIGDLEELTKPEVEHLKRDVLLDLQKRLVAKANLMQARFEKETQELQKKQHWYQQNQLSMSKEDEEAYLAYCSEAMFRISILEVRLAKHKEMAPVRYLALEEKLKNDPRL